MARFFSHMVSEKVQVFCGALQRGEFITDTAEAAGTYRKQGTRWVIANGGVRPRRGRNLQGWYLSFAEREETALGRARLIIGKRNASAIGTPVERSSGHTMLVHLPEGYKPEQVVPALAAKIQTLPAAVRRWLTWDSHKARRCATGNRSSSPPTSRSSSATRTSPGSAAPTRTTACCASTSKGSDLSVHSEADLDWVAAELNDRPRKRLGFRKPDEQIGELLLG